MNDDDELTRLAKLAVAHKAAEDAKLAAMTPAEREAYIHAWAKRIAEATVPVDIALDEWLNNGGLSR